MIKLDKLSIKNRNFGLKLFLSYIIFTFLLISSITIVHLYFSNDLKITKFQREVRLQSSEKTRQFKEYFKTKEDALIAISNNEYFLKFSLDGSYNYYIDLLFLTIMEANKDYMQMRFIDKNGIEKLRFDRQKQSKEPFKSGTLQDKSNRYYFKATSLLKKDNVWFSQIDLNVEHNIIEKPFKPVVRVATPIYINGEFNGILIINIFMEQLFVELTKSSLYDIYLVDDAGYFIKHKNPKYNWSLYDSKRSLDMDFDTQIVYKIQSTKEKTLQFKNNIFYQSLELDKQLMKLIMVEKESSINEVKNNNNIMVITILIFATIMAIFFTLLLTSPLKSLFNLVIKQADKLHELATNLDKKVEEKSLEIAKRDRLLQHQTKLAELGDMIGNIAHQWRHPLTRLSLTIQNLKAFKKKGKMSDEVLSEAIENSLYQIEFMSNTIDNFKDFYKKDKEKSEFFVSDSINGILKIIGTILEHDNIKIDVENKIKVLLFGNKNEFSQVLLNLIMNAKDALIENNINNASINILVDENKNFSTILISDNAGGIPIDIVTKIFDPYFTTKDDKGTGIGLYLSKAIIEDKMKGSLSVSNNKNGACFLIKLPV